MSAREDMTENGMISVGTGISVMPLWDHQAGNGVISHIITASLWGVNVFTPTPRSGF